MVDPLEYRKVVGGFATGVTIVTAVHDDEPYGMTANSLTSVSLEPVLLLVCFIRGSRTGIAVKETGWFGVNILEAGQVELSNRFARTTSDFDGVDYLEGPHGVPLFKESLGTIVCRVQRVIDGGDHDIVLGEVVDCARGNEGAAPLLYFRGAYRELAPEMAGEQ
jgi:flavin reductase (DIM6/NTAB) family NADH-FMN oxidoreductase RutF